MFKRKLTSFILALSLILSMATPALAVDWDLPITFDFQSNVSEGQTNPAWQVVSAKTLNITTDLDKLIYIGDLGYGPSLASASNATYLEFTLADNIPFKLNTLEITNLEAVGVNIRVTSAVGVQEFTLETGDSVTPLLNWESLTSFRIEKSSGAYFGINVDDVRISLEEVASTYSLAFNTNGGNGADVSGEYAAGASVDINAGTLDGYEFSGWASSDGGTFTDASSSSTTFTMPTTATTVTANWTPAAYSVTYNGNTNTGGAVPVDNEEYQNGDTATVLDNTGGLVKTGHTFTGWNTEAEGGGQSYVGGDTFAVGSSNVTLYAQWAPVVDAATPTFTTNLNPDLVTYQVDSGTITLTVVGDVTDTGTLTYQWYTNTIASTVGSVLHPGEVNSTLNIATEVPGELYFYCVVTNTNNGVNGTKVAQTLSNFAHIKVVPAAAGTPSIDTDLAVNIADHPNYNGNSVTLEIEASSPDAGTLTYKWFSCDNVLRANPVQVPGQVTDTFTPDLSTVKHHYYFCEVTNTLGDAIIPTATVRSAVAHINVTQPFAPQVPSIISDLPTVPVEYTQGSAATPLTVEVDAPADGGSLSYQWYKCENVAVSSAYVISGETGESYTPSTANIGTSYYMCIVTNTSMYSTVPTASARSSVVTVNVTEPAGPGAPTIHSLTPLYGDTVNAGMESNHFTVNATTAGAGETLNYEWFVKRPGDLDFVKVDGQTEATLTVIPENGGLYRIKVSVTASDTLGRTSNAVESETSSFSCVVPSYASSLEVGQQQLSDVSTTLGNAVAPLEFSVQKLTPDAGEITYKWYRSETNQLGDAMEIPGATGTSYTPPVNVASDFYYFCVATNHNPYAATVQVKELESDPARVTVRGPSYMFTTSGIGTGGENFSNWEAEEGDQISLNAGTRENYRFKRWVSSDGGTFTSSISPTTTFNMPANATTVEAEWERVYSVTVDYGHGPALYGTFAEGENITLIAGAREGSRFSSWVLYAPDTLTDGTTVYDTTIVVTMPAEDVSYAVSWNELYALTVDTAGGDGANASATYAQGDTIEIDAGTREGYVFAGWQAPEGMLADATQATTTLTMGDAPVTVTATWAERHALTIELDGGNGETSSGSYIADSVVSVAAGTRSGYTFSGWTTSNGGTFANASSAATTFTMPDSDTTVAATWTRVPSGGGGGGSVTTPANTAGDVKITTTSGQSTNPNDVKTTTTAGKTSVALSDNIMSTFVKEAITEGKQEGKASVTVTVGAPAQSGTVAVGIPVPSIETLANSGEKATLTVETPVGTVTLDQKALDTTAENAEGATVILEVAKVEKQALTTEQQRLVGDRPVIDLTITSSGKQISQLNGNATVSVPYTPAANENTSHLVVWYLADNGDLTPMPCEYKDGKLTFTTTHFSKYVVAKFPFKDVDGSNWFYKSVAKMNSLGIMNGTSETAFTPTASTTRGMVVAMLYRLASEPTESLTESFSDVQSGAYYGKAVGWASKNGFVNGVGAGKYAPDTSITREQLVSILYRYAGSPANTKENLLGAYTDADKIDAYATQAFHWAVKNGIIKGDTDTTLNPDGNATRAEIATMFSNYINNVIK